MDFVINLLVVAHFLGLAAILGGWLANRLGAGRGLPVLVWGARIQLLTGLLLVALHELGGDALNNAKIGVKLVVALAVVVFAELASVRARKDRPHGRLADAAAAGTVLNILVAVLWSTQS